MKSIILIVLIICLVFSIAAFFTGYVKGFNEGLEHCQEICMKTIEEQKNIIEIEGINKTNSITYVPRLFQTKT